MLIDMVRSIYGYNRWATERVLDTAAGLTPEEWLAPGTAGQGSVRDTLVHLVSAQRNWLAWWDGTIQPGQPRLPRLNAVEFPDLSSVRAAWAAVEKSTQSFLDRLSDSFLLRTYSRTEQDGRVFRLPLWQMMLHVANHGTQHRSEVAAMLTAAGHSPGDIDMNRYFNPYKDG